MKIYVLSDLHTECKPFLPDPQATEEAEVIVLAGDINPGLDGIIWAREAFTDKPIVYIAGNHEFYGQHWDDLLGQLRETARAHDIHFLENETAMIKGVRFLGCTLWTDFEFFEKSRRSQCMRAVENALADYDAIDAEFLPPDRVAAILGTPCSKKDEKSWSAKLTPFHTLERHQASRAWLQSEMVRGDPEKTVVVTHHYPHKNSTAVRYCKDLVTAGFGNSLPLDMLCQASLWIHGHLHQLQRPHLRSQLLKQTLHACSFKPHVAQPWRRLIGLRPWGLPPGSMINSIPRRATCIGPM